MKCVSRRIKPTRGFTREVPQELHENISMLRVSVSYQRQIQVRHISLQQAGSSHSGQGL